jgi:urease accessory protein
VLDDRDIVATLYVLTARAPARAVADCLHDTMRATVVDDTRFGVSVLPGDSGAWLRMVGDDTVTMARAWTAAWGAAHELLTGTRAPLIRK